ncbi:EcoKI restriction-modification system protein HsdS [Sphingobacterium multivorum]|uniref:EcoKI restriction-modification system protein HsdS n=1 Tax=Sphingobacterium multivorum TaxID=28454 RepID=A0A2X2J8X8_SPHMU|nr:restriction endonuclease subunit S [Sphingobacterium multivorum]SPZ83485.1 EcoKI restriction-modification system protein HsdS [Sphingobacterium multivorum]
MENKKLKVGNVPPLRFPGFEEEWQTKRLGEIADKVNSGKTPLGGEAVYTKEGILFIRSQNVNNDRLELDNSVFIPESVNNQMKNSIVNPNDILLNITGASLGRSCVVSNDFKIGNVNQHVCIIRLSQQYNPRFIQPIFSSNKGQIIFNNLQTGSGREGLNFESIKGIKLFTPILDEQLKIASFLSLIDERIQTQSKIIEELKLLKNTIRYQLYEQILNQENELVQVKDALNYEQPTKYLVTNTDYSSDISLIPVLTANKAFVLGYTDEEYGIYDKGQCIIFDDFTMDVKFVDFLFKVKSSAIKILTAKPNVNLKFIFEYLSFLNLSSNEHKRHYISEIEPMEIQLPNYIQQKHVANFLSSIDDKVKTEFEIHMLLIKQKQYLLANLFI